MQDPEQLIRNVQQGKYDGETSSEQEGYSKHKGIDPLSSNGEKIDTLRSLMDKLNDKKVRERSLLERDSEIPAARTLLSDKKSTCPDPCSDTPASVDCMKQCTTTVSSDTSACLDISISDVLAKVEPISGLQAPNQQVRLNYTLSVQNHCPQTIKDVTYQVKGTGGCPLPSKFIPAPDTGVYIQSFSADPSSVAPGDSAGVKAGQDTSLISRCETYGAGFRITSSSLPTSLSVDISASGTDSITNSMVHSQEKIFTVLGDSSWAARCDLKCPPATGTTSIVFVHGIKIGPEFGPTYLPQKGSDSGWDCSQYWGDAMNFLRERGLGDFRTIQYYNKDINCQNGNDEGRYSSDLHHPLYNSLCTNYHANASKDGTNDESLYHLSCLFAQYLNYNFGRSGRDVILVAHSMGGIIVRETMYQMQEHAGQSPFPDTIGHVTHAITFSSPHGGVSPLDNWGCLGCTQGTELSWKSDFMLELSTYGKNPQPSGGTDWTVIGSECDGVVGQSTAINMSARHAVVYSSKDKRKKATTTCYDHGGALKDSNIVMDAKRYYCDTSNPDNSPCGIEYKDKKGNTLGKWQYTENGLRGLAQLYYSVTGRFPSGAERVGSSRHLWLLSTAATAWALLRR